MLKVNVYIATDKSGVKNQHRAYASIVEFITKSGEPLTREAYGVEKATGNRIMLIALNSALCILTKPCEVTVYMNCPYVTETIRKGRVYEWISNGWKTIKGEPIANREEWEKIVRLTERHELVFVAVKKHSYSDRLQYDIRKLKGQNWQQQEIGGEGFNGD